MIDHANELRRHARKIPHPQGETPGVMLRAADEIERLRAKVEAMERQKPAGKFIQHPSNGLWEQDGYGDNPDARPLYALPGAQPTPSVPEGWKLVPVDPTLSMLTAAILSSHAINVHRAEHCYRAMIAVAPEAKP